MEVIEVIAGLLASVIKLIQAGEDVGVQEEALMEAAELLKTELDRRKFPAG